MLVEPGQAGRLAVHRVFRRRGRFPGHTARPAALRSPDTTAVGYECPGPPASAGPPARAIRVHTNRCLWTCGYCFRPGCHNLRSEEHTSELPSLMRISYAVFCL